MCHGASSGACFTSSAKRSPRRSASGGAVIIRGTRSSGARVVPTSEACVASPHRRERRRAAPAVALATTGRGSCLVPSRCTAGCGAEHSPHPPRRGSRSPPPLAGDRQHPFRHLGRARWSCRAQTSWRTASRSGWSDIPSRCGAPIRPGLRAVGPARERSPRRTATAHRTRAEGARGPGERDRERFRLERLVTFFE